MKPWSRVLVACAFVLLCLGACSEDKTAGNATEPNTVKHEIAITPAARLVDARDGASYKTINVAGFEKPETAVPVKALRWLAENLRYKTPRSLCYDHDEANCDKYGRYYNQEEAQIACPEGWRLPYDTEWPTAEELVDRGYLPLVPQKMELKFAGVASEAQFSKVEEIAYYWTIEQGSGYQTWEMIIPERVPALAYGYDESSSVSIRCVMDLE